MPLLEKLHTPVRTVLNAKDSLYVQVKKQGKEGDNTFYYKKIITYKFERIKNIALIFTYCFPEHEQLFGDTLSGILTNYNLVKQTRVIPVLQQNG